MLSSAKKISIVAVAALVAALVLGVVLTTSAYANLGYNGFNSSSSSMRTVAYDGSAQADAAGSQKFALESDAAAALNQLGATINRSGTIRSIPSAANSTWVAGEYEFDWNYGKSTGDYASHTSQVSFYETGAQYGCAVDKSLLDEYPKGTVIEFSWNGRTTTAVVNDCGVWGCKYGYTNRMFDLEPGTCEQLGWTAENRWRDGVAQMTWRVVSYG